MCGAVYSEVKCVVCSAVYSEVKCVVLFTPRCSV